MSDFEQKKQQVETQYNAGGDIHIYHRSPGRKPLHRPPRPIHFTDRKTELEQLLDNLQSGRVVTLCGPGGIGKTALAAEALWRLAPGNEPPSRFPDGLIFHSFYEQPDIDLALESIARAFGEEPKPTPASAAQRALSGKRALLILDGTENTNNLARIQAVVGDCAMLVTSRRRRDAISDRTDITPLEWHDAIKLLNAWSGGQNDDEAASRRITELVGGLPLAVRLVGRYLNETGDTATEYLQWLKTTPLEALDPDSSHHRQESVPWLLQRSLEQVSEKAQDVLAVFGQLALAPLSQNVVKDALQLSTGAMKLAFRELTGYGLLLPVGTSHYEVTHALIHTYTRERLYVKDGTLALLISRAQGLLADMSRMGLEGFHRLESERPHLLRLLDNCAKRNEWDTVYHFARAIEYYLDIQGYWTEQLIVNMTALRAAREQGNKQREGYWLDSLGSTYHKLGQEEKAIGCHEQALAIARIIGDRRNEGSILGNLGIAYGDLGHVHKAIDFYEQALVISRETGNQKGESNQLSSLGIAHSLLGQDGTAIGFYEQALVIARRLGDRRNEGYILGNLGISCRVLGQIEKAIGFYEQTLVIAREIGDRRSEGTNLGNLGLSYAQLGQDEKAISLYKQALTIVREIGDRRTESNNLRSLGGVYLGQGQVEKAIGLYEQGLVIARETRYQRGVCITLGNLGLAYSQLGQDEKAISLYEQALTIGREIGDKHTESEFLKKLGDTYLLRSQAKKAIGLYEQALIISRKNGNQFDESRQMNNLGIAHSLLGKEQKAIGFYEKALTIVREIGNKHIESLILGNLEVCHQKPGQVDNATRSLSIC